MHWADDFVKAAIQTNSLTDKTLFELCDAFYGRKPTIRTIRGREDTPGFDVEIEYGNTWNKSSGIELDLAWRIDLAMLDGMPIRLNEKNKFGDHGSAHYDGTLKAGQHQLTIEFDCAYFDRNRLIGLNVADLPQPIWPAARKRWRQSVSIPVKIFPAGAPLVTLVTDPNRSPDGVMRVARLVAQVDRAGKKIILNFTTSNGPCIPVSCDVAVMLGDQLVPLGRFWRVKTNDVSMGSGNTLEAHVEALDPVIKSGDVILTPNASYIERRATVLEIWGKKIVLPNIRMERLDLDAGR